MIVIDASVLANVVGDDGADGDRAREVLRQDPDVHAPDIINIETVAVLRKRWVAGSLPARRFAAAVRDLHDLDIVRYPTLPLTWRAYELRENVTAYDAVYVALAEGLDCSLVTADARLSRAPGLRCDVEVVTTGS